MKGTKMNSIAMVRDFKAVGFTQEQAEKIVETVENHSNEQLASKQDLLELQLKLESRFARLEITQAIILIVLLIPTLKSLFA
jgi:hypothetical protein